jgi:hypothetical protein
MNGSGTPHRPCLIYTEHGFPVWGTAMESLDACDLLADGRRLKNRLCRDWDTKLDIREPKPHSLAGVRNDPSDWCGSTCMEAKRQRR